MSSKKKNTQSDDDIVGNFIDNFGQFPLEIFEISSVKYTWRYSFLANHLNLPLYREIAKSTGLNRPEVVTLLALYETDSLLASEICLVSGQPKNSISRAVSQLLKYELIARRDDQGDKRAKQLMITAEGRKTIEPIIEQFVSRQNLMRKALSEEELEVFDALLHKLLLGMSDWVREGVEIPKLGK